MSANIFERSSFHNIRIHVMPTDRFKTYAVSVYIGSPLTEQTITPIALIPFVLRRGTQQFPSTIDFHRKLDDLYGAGFGFDVFKRGDYQIVQFRMDTIQESYVQQPESLLKQAISFLGNVITQPALENGYFAEKYVETEKINVKQKIEAIINDKIRYAEERCLQEMCRHEPYRLNSLGTIEALQTMDAQTLYVQYEQWLQQSPIDLYVVGNTNLKEVENMVMQSFQINQNQVVPYQIKPAKHQPTQVRTVIERLEVLQGKLNMGLRTPITYADEDYPTLLMYNGVLGGYAHSKLFINVREKASLAYYASSRLDGHKGILLIRSGIEVNNYEKASQIIRDQLLAMKAGDISELELVQTKEMIHNQLREIQDSAFELISFDYNTVLSGKERNIAELISSIALVDGQMISKAAQQVHLDTIYFLRDMQEQTVGGGIIK